MWSKRLVVLAAWLAVAPCLAGAGAGDAQQRLKRFADRTSPRAVEALARELFAMLADDVPALAPARALLAEGKHAQALDAWKHYWFAKMKRANLHVACQGDYFTHPIQGDVLVAGRAVTTGPTSAPAARLVPGSIPWIDIPAAASQPGDAGALAKALTDCQQKAKVGWVSRPLLDAYRARPNAACIRRWAEIMDDWCLNFFADAQATPYEVEMLFTFDPARHWGRMMEDLSDLAVAHPELVDQVPAATLARIQLLCLEKYSTAWWRQARGTVFSDQIGGIVAWDHVWPYISEFLPARRARREWQQQFERWMTLGTEPDGSMAEIGDDGHMIMPMQLGVTLYRLEHAAPPEAFYTPGWRNRAMEWYDNTFEYLFRHMAPGGFEHRFGVAYRPERLISQVEPLAAGRPKGQVQLDRGPVVWAIPEVRRVLDAVGHVSAGLPEPEDPIRLPIVRAQRKTRAAVLGVLGDDKPGPPHLNSDWMPYTGAYYFRGGWDDREAFLAMMACGSHGGSQPAQWPYGMYYFYDWDYPLLKSQPIQIDGLPPNQLFGRRSFEPGTKTDALTYAEHTPAPFRWHSGRVDVGEAIYHGAYQKPPTFKGQWDYTLEQAPPGKAIEDVHTARQVLHLRGERLFVVTESVRFARPEDAAAEHRFSIPYRFELSTREKGPSRPFGPEQLQFETTDAGTRCVRSCNPDGPSVSLYQFTDCPIRYVRGPNAKPDFRSYSARLTGQVGIAEQEVTAELAAPGGAGLTLVSVIASSPPGGQDRIAGIEPHNVGLGVAGFRATLRWGDQIAYQAAPAGRPARLQCGQAGATAEALLVMVPKTGGDLNGIVLGGKSLSLFGRDVPGAVGDFEYHAANGVAEGTGKVTITPIYTPIDPVAFLPDRNTFTDTLAVEMASRTPGVEIRYTTDGTQPTRASKLYTAAVTIAETTEFAARAYRRGPDGRAVEADDFEINGTHFSLPTYGWFYKKPFLPAVQADEKALLPGLNYEYLQAPWWRLYAAWHWLAAERFGVAEREMDLSAVSTNDTYGMRYKGYIRIPQDGVYTFHAPDELAYMDEEAGYDLRVYVDSEEWYLTQWWHGHGTWSVALRKGLHTFEVDFADARTTPWRKSGMYRYYPRPWVIHQGKPGDILLSGPGLEKVRIPSAWLCRKASGK
jgi:hypothetical protein